MFLPHSHSCHSRISSPNEYSTLWAELAHGVNPTQSRVEVRVGCKSQHLPITVRLMDKMSSWGRDGGLQSIIPSVLSLGVIGYPFILPDMIGGNAYEDYEITIKGDIPDRELYIRWMQTCIFMPSVQFSIVPWMYDDEVLAITKQLLKVREEYAPTFISLAEESAKNHFPIIRPLWWLEPENEDALVVDDEFLVGNDLLVTPVVTQGGRKRDVFIPTGSWKDTLRGEVIEGPILVKDYSVALNELPFFERVKE